MRLVPAPADERSHRRGELLIRIHAETVLDSTLLRGAFDRGHVIDTALESLHGLLIVAPISVIEIAKQPDGRCPLENRGLEVGFDVLRAGASKIPLQSTSNSASVLSASL